MSKDKNKAKKKHQRPWAKLICNPGAGDGKDFTTRLEQVTRWLGSDGRQVEVALAHPKAKATVIARKAARAGYKLVIAMGGDGTIEAVMRGLVGSKTRLGILPVGTFNNIAKSLGIPEDLESACALLRDGPVRRLDMGRVKTRQKGKFRFFELAALGLTASIYPQTKNITKGNWGQLRDALSTLVHYQTPKVTLALDGESHIETETMLVTIANTPAFGANFLVAPQASLEDGLLDISVYPNFSKAELLAYFARVAREGYFEDNRIQRYRARKLKIQADPKQEIMADGIMLGKGKVVIRVLPGALRVVAPEQTGLAAEPPPVREELPTPVSPSPSLNPAPSAAREAASNEQEPDASPNGLDKDGRTVGAGQNDADPRTETAEQKST
ncbi:MAG TPA: YegS/Rv2252/BmrU family lipid kinase [Anaerolineales bacterium]